MELAYPKRGKTFKNKENNNNIPCNFIRRILDLNINYIGR